MLSKRRRACSINRGKYDAAGGIDERKLREMPIKGDNKYDERIILSEIYRMKLLSVDQLTQVIFDNARYGHRFMDKLEAEGLVNSRIVLDGRRRQGKVYYLSDKGINLLEKENLIDKVRLAKDNVPGKAKMSHTLRINNIYAGLTPYLTKGIQS